VTLNFIYIRFSPQPFAQATRFPSCCLPADDCYSPIIGLVSRSTLLGESYISRFIAVRAQFHPAWTQIATKCQQWRPRRIYCASSLIANHQLTMRASSPYQQGQTLMYCFLLLKCCIPSQVI
jgi:hypothetical protein